VRDFTGRTARHVAVSMDNPLAASQLCAHGFDALTKDKTGMTPLQLAVDGGFADVLRELAACDSSGAAAAAVAKTDAGVFCSLLSSEFPLRSIE
jgi:hypothetical protein